MKRSWFVMLGLSLLACALAMPTTASAQQEDIRKKKVSLEIQDADVRDALKLLFDAAGVQNYTVASDVQGTVTVKLTDVPFETALRSILDQVDATYSFEAGLIRIFKREKPTVTPTTEQPSIQTTKVTRKIPILHADPYLIALLLSGQGAQFGIPPEWSTAATGGFGGFGGGGFGGGGFGGGGFGGGGFGAGYGGGGFGGGGFGGGGFGGGGFGGGGFGGGGIGGGGGGRFGGGR